MVQDWANPGTHLSVDLKVLLVSPERLANEAFLSGMSEIGCLSLAVIDEAHCISEWYKRNYTFLISQKIHIPAPWIFSHFYAVLFQYKDRSYAMLKTNSFVYFVNGANISFCLTALLLKPISPRSSIFGLQVSQWPPCLLITLPTSLPPFWFLEGPIISGPPTFAWAKFSRLHWNLKLYLP